MDPTRQFADLMRLPEAEVHLDEALLLIAAHAYPLLDVDGELAALDRLAEGCAEPTLDGLVGWMFRTLAFGGNERDYYDPRNSFLNEVRRRRTGIPITLSVLTMELGRRVGVQVAGVAMPGHFLLRDRVDPGVFVDPFHGGAFLDEAGCEAAFRSVHGEQMAFDPAFLTPVGAFTVVARVLANLGVVFQARDDQHSRAWVAGLRCLVPGVPIDDHREWASALALIGQYDQAAAVLRAVAPLLPPPEAEAHEREARRLRSLLN